MRNKLLLLPLAFLCLLLGSCSTSPFSGSSSRVDVVLDIGHFVGGEGAVAPGLVNGKRLAENSFWYQYSYYVKRVIERAGYSCVVTNRGFKPASQPLAGYASRARVIHLRRPDKGGKRSPSHYHPDRVGSGVVSADYAIYRQAGCAVFLHHNSSSSRWKNGASDSLIICNRYNGRRLAQCLSKRLEREILNHRMPNGGRGCRVAPRYVDADRSAAWMNACDDSGIPAAVVEAAYLNNRGHAAFLANEANARLYAETVGKGIVDYLKRYGHEPRHRRINGNVADEGSFGYAAESRRLSVPGAKLLLPR